MKYSSTFIFELKELDDEFHRLNDEIAERARELPGFLGEETWHNPETGLHAEVYYWSDMDSLRKLVGMDTHGIAKGRHSEWLGKYRVVISEIKAIYGNPTLGLEHTPQTSGYESASSATVDGNELPTKRPQSAKPTQRGGEAMVLEDNSGTDT